MAQRQAHPEQAVGGTLDARPWFDGVGEGPVPAAHSRHTAGFDRDTRPVCAVTERATPGPPAE